MNNLYPEDLREREVTATASVWIEVSGDGRVLGSTLAESSGYPAIDEAAVRAARVFEFEPSGLEACPEPARVAIPITFAPTG